MRLPSLRPRRWTSDPEWTPDWQEEGVHERRLGEATVRFAGFTPKRIRRNLRKFDLQVRERPRLLELENVLYMPRLRCLYTAEGARIDESMWTYAEPDVPEWVSLDAKMGAKADAYMPARIEPPEAPERRRETVVYLGEAKQHYGHFITDGMSRMWALPQVEAPVRVVVHLNPDLAYDLAPIRAVWEALGFAAGSLERPLRPVLFDKVICPVPAIQLTRRIYREFDAPHRRAAEVIAGRGGKGPERAVYLSRRQLGGERRRLIGEDLLEQRLEREGYCVVYPETLSMAEQIALFNGDRPVVGPTGSALHTVLFRTRRRGLKMAVLTPEDVGGRFPLIDMLKASRTTYVNAMRDVTPAEGSEAVPHSQRSWEIDVERAMAFLDGAGFLGRRWR